MLNDGCEYDNEHDPVKDMKQDERSDESKIERPLCSSATVIRYHTVKHYSWDSGSYNDCVCMTNTTYAGI